MNNKVAIAAPITPSLILTLQFGTIIYIEANRVKPVKKLDNFSVNQPLSISIAFPKGFRDESSNPEAKPTATEPINAPKVTKVQK